MEHTAAYLGGRASGMPDQTIRYYATSPQAYARALLALTAYARISQDNFAFGPLDLAALENQGLTVTGSSTDLARVREMLARIDGLAEHDGQEER